MNISNIELRHIVDVDGQLLGIDAEVVEPATLLAWAKRPAGSQLWLVRAGERIAIGARQAIRLSEDAAGRSRSCWRREGTKVTAFVMVEGQHRHAAGDSTR